MNDDHKKLITVPAIITLLSFTGCAQKNAREAWLYREFNSGPADALKVMHMDTETESLAGFPIRLYCFVTANRSPMMITSAVIEGYASFMLEDEMKRYTAGRLCDCSWAILASRGVPELPNRIDPTVSLDAGEGVAVGGFFLPPLRPTPIEFADIPPSIVTGQLLAFGAEAELDAAAGSVAAVEMNAEQSRCVLVPFGDYRGFLGGPAARRDADGTYTVWGVIVSNSTFRIGAMPIGTLLHVEVLPAGLKSDNNTTQQSE